MRSESLREQAGEASGDALATLLWDIRDLQSQLRIGRTFAWELVRRDGFPAPVAFSPRRLRWEADAVIAYIRVQAEPSWYRARPDADSAIPGGYRVRQRRRRPGAS